MKKRRNNYSSGDVDEDIKKIQTGEISQDKAVHEYGITRQTLARKYRNKRYNVADKRPGYLPVLGEETEKDLVRWELAIQKQGLLVGQDIISQKNFEIHRYMFGSMRSVGSAGRGCCDLFMSQHGELTLRTDQVINRARNEASLEELRRFFCELCQHII